MHREEIKAAMRMKGITPTALAGELGVSNVTVSQVISGRSVSARVAQRIAEVIGKPVEMIWPPKPKLVLRRTKATTTTAANQT